MRISDWSSDVCSSDLIAGEDEALTLPPRQPLINEMIGAGIERGRHRCAEPAAQRGRIAVDQMAVEPGRALGRDLMVQREVGAGGERMPLLALVIFP